MLAADDAAGGKIGAGNDVDELIDADIGLVDQADDAIADFGEVVRRDFGGHADGDAVGAIDEEVRELGGQDERLAVFAVVVIDEIDGVALQIFKHLGGDVDELGLGVTHVGGGQAADGAEVSLGLDQRMAQVPPLAHADQRRIDGGVAVRMVALHRLADDGGAFRGRGVRPQPEIVHRQKDAPLRRLQTIAHVRQRPADDDAHRVAEIAVLQLVFDLQ